MNVLYITMSPVMDVSVNGVHTDIMRKFRDEGHNVFILSPRERRQGISTVMIDDHGICNLGVRTLNVQKTNVIEKGLGQLLIGLFFKRAVKKYLGGIKFDVIVYATPPISLVGIIRYVRRKNPEAVTYLTLKDIFPQNAVDLGMLSKSGLKGLLYFFFRKMEKRLYQESDWIGCMSPANVKYLIDHNSDIDPAKVEICPNSFCIPEVSDPARNIALLEKYGLPADKPIFFYGGNLGKPQGIPFLIKCLDANRMRDDCHFLIVGNGFDFPLIRRWFETSSPHNVTLMERLPRNEYDALAASCDVGLIFLDYRFTIPNYPSRLLNCLSQKKPIIACTDSSCDIGTIAEANGYGYWCPSNDVGSFTDTIDRMLASDMAAMGERGYDYFLSHYTVDIAYETIMRHFVQSPHLQNQTLK